MRAALDQFRRLGAVDGILFVLASLLVRLSRGRVQLRKYYFMAQPVPRSAHLVARAAGITVEELRADDPRLPQLRRSPRELERRFLSSSRCFAAWKGSALAGFLWFTEHEYAEDEVRITFRVHPADRAVWDLDVHIEPRYRLGRTFALLWESAFAAMQAQGTRWTLSRVSAFNADSIRAHQRLGARPTGWAIFVLSGRFQLVLRSGGQMKGRRLEQGPYPVMEVRAPAVGSAAQPADEAERVAGA